MSLNSTVKHKYVFDAWNRLVEAKRSQTVVQENEYDGLNRRIVRDETGGSGVVTHFYYNNQWQVAEERVGSATTADIQYIYHPNYVDAVAVRYWDEDNSANDVLETDHYYLQDANFNVTAVTDDTGTVKERYSYTPYGEVTILDADFSADADNKSDIGNEYLYTGRRLDPETNLQLNRNRFYHATMGRWVNRDPIGYFGSEWNLYEYVNGMPTVGLDSSGLFITGGIEWPDPGPVTPITSDSPQCDDYPCDDTYQGANSRCFCKCAGDSPWSNYVRGCLRKLKNQKPPVSNTAAHAICYRAADKQDFPGGRPWGTLLGCWVSCQPIDRFVIIASD